MAPTQEQIRSLLYQTSQMRTTEDMPSMIPTALHHGNPERNRIFDLDAPEVVEDEVVEDEAAEESAPEETPEVVEDETEETPEPEAPKPPRSRAKRRAADDLLAEIEQEQAEAAK